MEAKLNRPQTRAPILFFISLLLAQGCASASKKNPLPEEPGPVSQSPLPGAVISGPPEAYGPPLPDAQPTYGPEPIPIRPLVLVLGPGLARGYAYAGVLQGLKEAKIPVGAVIATEMGALMGGLFAMNANTNQLEWGMLKLKEDLFKEQSGILGRFRGDPAHGEKFEAQLRQIFEKKNLKHAKVPIWIGILTGSSAVPRLVHEGEWVEILRATMATPGLFSPGSWTTAEGQITALSPAMVHPFFVSEAKSLGRGAVVVIDVLTDEESAIALDELKVADLVIRPDMRDIGAKDFHRKTDAAFRGKNAIIQHKAELLRLAGMSPAE